MTRLDLIKLALIRLKESRILLDKRCFEGAYYLAGYSVECGLKACIAKQVRRSEFPPRDAVKLYTHNLHDLAVRAGIETALTSTSVALSLNWATVARWSELSRYTLPAQSAAEELFTAISARSNGVITCIRRFW